MKTNLWMVLVFSVTGFWGCQNKQTSEQSVPAGIKDTAIVEKAETSTYVDDGCTGRAPDHSIVDSVKYPHRKFHFADRMGYDEFVTNEGDSITLIRSNCDYSVMSFVISSARLEHDTEDKLFWVNTIHSILKSACKLLLYVPVNIDSGMLYLERFDKSDSIRLSEDYTFMKNYDFLSKVTIEGIECSEGKTRLRVTFTEGPL